MGGDPQITVGFLKKSVNRYDKHGNCY
jgi:hypothetical protein